MVPSRLLAAAVLAAALAFPATAGAGQRAAESHGSAAPKAVSRASVAAPLAAAAAVGRRYWGTTPCNGQIRFIAQRPLAAGLDATSDAWVTFDSSMGANNLAAPASSYTSCVIAFARWRWPTTASMREDWDIFCATMIHELGHLLGHLHDSTPGSVMTPVFSDHSSVPKLCRQTRPARSTRSGERRRH